MACKVHEWREIGRGVCTTCNQSTRVDLECTVCGTRTGGPGGCRYGGNHPEPKKK